MILVCWRHGVDRLRTEWDHLRAAIGFHYLVELRQVKVDKTGAIREAIVR